MGALGVTADFVGAFSQVKLEGSADDWVTGCELAVAAVFSEAASLEGPGSPGSGDLIPSTCAGAVNVRGDSGAVVSTAAVPRPAAPIAAGGVVCTTGCGAAAFQGCPVFEVAEVADANSSDAAFGAAVRVGR